MFSIISVGIAIGWWQQLIWEQLEWS